MMSGWIKLHRSLLDWEWYDDVNVRLVFMHCLLQANFKDRSHKGVLFERGTFPCGRDQLAKDIGISTQQLRTSLRKLESTGEISIKSTSKGTKITLCNYDTYQDIQPEGQPAINQQSTSNQPTINHSIRKKEGKKEEKVSKRFTPPTVEQVHEYGTSRESGFNDAERFCDFYESKGWLVGKSKMKCWKAAVRNWMKNKQYNQQTSTPQTQFRI